MPTASVNHFSGAPHRTPSLILWGDGPVDAGPHYDWVMSSRVRVDEGNTTALPDPAESTTSQSERTTSVLAHGPRILRSRKAAPTPAGDLRGRVHLDATTREGDHAQR